MVPSGLQLFLGLAVTALFSRQADARVPGETEGASRDLCVIRTSCVSLRDANDLALRIRAIGGNIGVILSPAAMLGWVSAEREGQVAGLPQVVRLVREGSIGELPTGSSLPDRSLRLLPSLMDHYGTPFARSSAADNQPLSDDVDMTEFARRAKRPALLGGEGSDPYYPHAEFANSEQMIGSVMCSLFLVESDGSIDSNRFTWTTDAQAQVVAAATRDLLNWSHEAGRNGKELTFSLLIYPADTSVMQQPYEPILRDFAQFPLIGSAIFTNLGYPPHDDSGINMCAYLTDLRRQYGADRAFCAFIVYNPQNEGAPWTFADGRPGAASWGGPHLILPSTRAVDGSFGHEVGHIFYALDEYGGASCGVVFNGVYNRNAAMGDCGPHYPCFMRESAPAVCPYTAAHVGWKELAPAPTLLAPIDHAGVRPGEISFRWNPNNPEAGTYTFLRVTDMDSGLSVYYEDGRRLTDPPMIYSEPARSVSLPAGTYTWSAVNGGSAWSQVSSVSRVLHVTESAPAPISGAAFGVFPNPSSGEATLFFETTDRNPTMIDIYTILGQRMTILNHASGFAGSQNVKVQTRGFAPGVYVYRIHNGRQVQCGKMVIAR